jgi:hypothetical protein
VIGVASPDGLEAVSDLGAHEVVDGGVIRPLIDSVFRSATPAPHSSAASPAASAARSSFVSSACSKLRGRCLRSATRGDGSCGIGFMIARRGRSKRRRHPRQGQGVGRTSQSVGVQPQYTGTAGRIENPQVAVYLVPVAACFVGGLLAIWWAEVIRRGRCDVLTGVGGVTAGT